MSFREKSAWISLLTMAAIYGSYFWSLVRAPRTVDGFGIGGALVRTVVLLVIAQIILHVVVAIHRPADARAPLDERERQIATAAARIAYYGLASGVALACCFGAVNPPVLFAASSLLFLLVAGEMLRAASQIYLYRRSA